MKKTVLLSFTVSTMIMAGGDLAPAPAPVVEVEKDLGDIFGQSRTFYLDRTYTGGIENNRNALSTGGYIGYKTPEFSGFTAAIAVYGTYGFTLHDESASDYFDLGGRSLASNYYDPAMYGEYFDNYAFIGQAYINYAFANTKINAGRQVLDTPLVGADDARMIPNLFEAVIVSNTDIKNTTLIGGHVFREAIGTFGHVYTPGALSLQSGYGLGLSGIGKDSGEFINMGTVALGQDVDGKDITTDGVTVLAAIYDNEDLKLQAWDYYAHDILNAVYLQADYGWSCLLNNDVKMTASAQYINESDVGDQLAGNVDSNYGAVKLNAAYGALIGYAAYSKTADSDGTMNGGILTPWGGMPAFTQGMVTRHMFFADTDATKVSGTYSFKEMTDLELKVSVYYISFNIGEVATYASGLSSSESGFDIEYQATKVLNLRFKGNFPRDFGTTVDGPFNWDEYRLIVNYSF